MAQKSKTPGLLTQQTNDQVTLIQHVNIFDGKNKQLLTDQDVLIKNGLISQISVGGSINKSIADQLISGQGRTLMPGLIDAHVHVTGSGAVPWKKVKANVEYNLNSYLYSGITTVYDLGGLASQLKKIKSKIKKGTILGPDVYNTHIPVTVKDSHPIPLTKLMLPWPLKTMVNAISPTINKPKDAKKIVRSYVKKKVDYMKISCDQIPPGSPEMPFNSMKALVEESHKHGLTVFVHIGSVDNAMTAVRAGADILAHGIWRDRLTEEQADNIAQSGIKVVYTLAGFYNVDKINKGEFSPSELDKRLVPCCVLDPVSHEHGKDVHKQEVMNAFFQNVSDHRPHWEHNFSLLKERGVQILVGTDSQLPGTYAGSTYHQEVGLLKEFGMSNFEVLKAATYGNSRLFLDQPDFGTVEVGKKANLILLEGNPLIDLSHLQQISHIFKNGTILTHSR